MTSKGPENNAAKDEQIRLLEYQLDYLRAELLHLSHERDKMVYSASWHIFRPLRRLEARLVDAASALWRGRGTPAAQNAGALA